MKKDKEYKKFIFYLTGVVISCILFGILLGTFIGAPLYSKLTQCHEGEYKCYSIYIYPESGKAIIRTDIKNVQQYKDKLVVLGKSVVGVKD